MKTNDSGYILCPVCGKPTKVKILPETRLEKFPLFCQKCKRETIITK